MNLHTIATLFGAEIRMILRDRRLIVTAIVLPVLMMPLLFLGTNWSMKHRQRTLGEAHYYYALAGSNTNWLREILQATRQREQQQRTNSFQFEEIASGDPPADLAEGRIHFIVESGATNKSELRRAEPRRTTAKESAKRNHRPRSDSGEKALPGVPELRIVFRGDRDYSVTAMDRLSAALERTRRDRRADLMAARGFSAAPSDVAAVRATDLAPERQVSGLALGRALTFFVLVFVLTGGAVVATDSVAGEKERGTLETLLTTAANRVEIVAAKHLVICAVALAILLVQVVNLLGYSALKLTPAAIRSVSSIDPGTAALLVLLYLPVVALLAGILLLISGRARSYKEAQMFLFPVFLITLVPAAAPMLPGLDLRSAIVLVPIANVAVGARSVLGGSVDWIFLALAWLVTAAAAVWTSRLTVQTLSSERLIATGDSDAAELAGGQEVFSRKVLSWYAVLWALLLIISNYAAKLDLRLQVVINLVGLFFVSSCVMLRVYRLDWRETLAWRWPRPGAWLGALLAVPGGLLAATGLFRLVSVFLPVSSKMMEQFDEAVLPESLPLWQVLFFIAVLPGLFEEIAFRGLLMHGLSRRLRPVPLALVVGLIFGLFHATLFRLAPTAALGVLLAAVTLLTGSIFPAMVMHSLSNATSVFCYKFGIPLAELPPFCYWLGVLTLAAGLRIIWRNRSPYPGLRQRQTHF